MRRAKTVLLEMLAPQTKVAARAAVAGVVGEVRGGGRSRREREGGRWGDGGRVYEQGCAWGGSEWGGWWIGRGRRNDKAWRGHRRRWRGRRRRVFRRWGGPWRI